MPHGRGEPRSAASTLALALLLAAPVALTPIAARAIVDHIATAAGAQIAALSERLAPPSERPEQAPSPPTPEPSPFGVELSGGDRALETDLPSPDNPSRASPSRDIRPQPHRASAPPHRGILVRADLVARAVRSGVRPSGAPVAASGMRPSGVVIQGVSAFGAGLFDGDIVTAVGGTATTSPAMIVAAVAGAVRSGARALSAVIWRDQQQIRVTVEIPQITARAQRDDAR